MPNPAAMDDENELIGGIQRSLDTMQHNHLRRVDVNDQEVRALEAGIKKASTSWFTVLRRDKKVAELTQKLSNRNDPAVMEDFNKSSKSQYASPDYGKLSPYDPAMFDDVCKSNPNPDVVLMRQSLSNDFVKGFEGLLAEGVTVEERAANFEKAMQKSLDEAKKSLDGIIDPTVDPANNAKEYQNLQKIFNEKKLDELKLLNRTLQNQALCDASIIYSRMIDGKIETWENREKEALPAPSTPGSMATLGAQEATKLKNGDWKSQPSGVWVNLNDGVVTPFPSPSVKDPAAYKAAYGAAMRLLARTGATSVIIDFPSPDKVSIKEIKMLVELAKENGLKVEFSETVKNVLRNGNDEFKVMKAGSYAEKWHKFLGRDLADDIYNLAKDTNQAVADRYPLSKARSADAVNCDKRIEEIKLLTAGLDTLTGPPLKEKIESAQVGIISRMQDLMIKDSGYASYAQKECHALQDSINAMDKAAGKLSDPEAVAELREWCLSASEAVKELPNRVQMTVQEMVAHGEHVASEVASIVADDRMIGGDEPRSKEVARCFQEYVTALNGAPVERAALEAYLVNHVNLPDLAGDEKKEFCENASKTVFDLYAKNFAESITADAAAQPDDDLSSRRSSVSYSESEESEIARLEEEKEDVQHQDNIEIVVDQEPEPEPELHEIEVIDELVEILKMPDDEAKYDPQYNNDLNGLTLRELCETALEELREVKENGGDELKEQQLVSVINKANEVLELKGEQPINLNQINRPRAPT